MAFLERVLKRAIPRAVDSYSPPPQELAPGLWVLDRQFLHFGSTRLPSRTTIVKLTDGTLVVVSPPPVIDPLSASAIDSIGTVRHVVVPNPFHYLHAAEFMARCPTAKLFAAPGLVARVPELGFAQELGPQSPDAWSGELEHLVLGPVRGLSEVLLFHVSTATLILTDLAFNMVRYPRPFDRLVWRLSGIPAGFGPGRTSRSLLLRDRALASDCLERALEWPIRRIVVAHGEAVTRDPRSELRNAFRRYL